MESCSKDKATLHQGFIFPVGVTPGSHAKSHEGYKHSLRGLLSATSGTYSCDIPSGTTARAAFFAPMIFFIAGARYPLNVPRTGILLLCTSTPGLPLQTMFSHSFIKSVDIHPWFWHLTIIPVGSWSFSIVFRFKITYGGNFIPSANTASITVMHIFSFPKVLMMTDFVPISSMTLLDGSSKETGVSSAFPIWLSR